MTNNSRTLCLWSYKIARILFIFTLRVRQKRNMTLSLILQLITVAESSGYSPLALPVFLLTLYFREGFLFFLEISDKNSMNYHNFCLINWKISISESLNSASSESFYVTLAISTTGKKSHYFSIKQNFSHLLDSWSYLSQVHRWAKSLQKIQASEKVSNDSELRALGQNCPP